MKSTQSKYLSLIQTAHRLGVPTAWLKREADAGRVPCLRVGRRRMFDLDAVRAELDHRAQTATKATTQQEATA